MQIVTIKSETITVPSIGEDGNPTTTQAMRPVIPFDQFPKGQRNAGPDKDGNLVWTVIVED